MSKWSWVYWALDEDGQTFVGAYETDGMNIHGTFPPADKSYYLVSGAQYRSLYLELRHRADAAFRSGPVE